MRVRVPRIYRWARMGAAQEISLVRNNARFGICAFDRSALVAAR